MITITATINGEVVNAEVDEPLMLVDFLRDRLGLLGTRIACDRGVCGVCTVLMDGLLVASCNTFAFEADGRVLQTIEADDPGVTALQQAFLTKGGLQCGYCTPGMILLAKTLIDRNPRPTFAEIVQGMSANICRCTGYQQIVDAVRSVVEEG